LPSYRRCGKKKGCPPKKNIDRQKNNDECEFSTMLAKHTQNTQKRNEGLKRRGGRRGRSQSSSSPVQLFPFRVIPYDMGGAELGVASLCEGFDGDGGDRGAHGVVSVFV